MKTAIVAVSKKAIEQAGKLKELYPSAQIHVPARFCCDQTFERGLSVCGDRPDLHSGVNSQDSTNLDKLSPTKPLSPESQKTAEHQSEGLPLTPLLSEGQEPTGPHREGLPLNPLPLEGGGSGWGCKRINRPEGKEPGSSLPPEGQEPTGHHREGLLSNSLPYEGQECPWPNSESLPLNPLPQGGQECPWPNSEGLPLNPLPLEGGGSGWGWRVLSFTRSLISGFRLPNPQGSRWGCRPEPAFSAVTTPQGLTPLSGSFSEAVAGLFESHRLLIFISATAVAVRAIAPCLKSKAKDPAVVVVDEQAKFAISLLSGHLGGANEETLKIARCLGAQPVITTATDNRGITAFDDLARRLGWQIENLPDLKKISAALLEEREIILYSDYPFTCPLKGSIKIAENPEQLKEALNGYVLVSSREVPLPVLPGYPHIILRPPVIAAGMGCRRGVPAEAIIKAVENAFIEAGLSIASLSCLASGEFKADEEGLIEAAKHFGVELKIFTREEISANLGDSQISDFVQEQVGVGAVAEPCARLGSEGGDLLLPTIRKNNITIALATTKP